MLGTDLSSSKALLVGVLLLTTGLAGCASSGEGSSLLYSSFGEARSAPGGGPFSPNVTASQLSSLSEEEANQIKLKVLVPQSLEGLETGEQDVVVLLYDASSDEPITDATFGIAARMPSMGHGTSPETDPVHKQAGQYQGLTTWSMKGSWDLNFDVQLSSGDVLHYDVPVKVGQGGHDHGGHEH